MPSSQIHAVLREFLGTEAVKLKNLITLYHALSKVQKTLKDQTNPNKEQKDALTLLLPMVQNLSELVKIVPAETEELKPKAYEATAIQCLRSNVGMDIAPAKHEESYEELGYKLLNYACSPIFTKIRLIAALLCTKHTELSALIQKECPAENQLVLQSALSASVHVASNSALVADRLKSELKKLKGTNDIPVESYKILKSIFKVFKAMSTSIGTYFNNIRPPNDLPEKQPPVDATVKEISFEPDAMQDATPLKELKIPTVFPELGKFLDDLMGKIKDKNTVLATLGKAKDAVKGMAPLQGNMISCLACKHLSILMDLYVLRDSLNEEESLDFDKRLEKHLFDLAIWLCVTQAQKNLDSTKKRNATQLDPEIGKGIEKLNEEHNGPAIEDKSILNKLKVHENLFHQGLTKREVELAVIPLLQYTVALHNAMRLMLGTPNAELVNNSHYRIPTEPVPVEQVIEAQTTTVITPSSPRSIDLGPAKRKGSTTLISNPKSPRGTEPGEDNLPQQRGRSSSAAGALLKTFKRKMSAAVRSLTEEKEDSIVISSPSSPRPSEPSVSSQSLFSSPPGSPRPSMSARKGSDPLIAELQERLSFRDQDSPRPSTPKS